MIPHDVAVYFISVFPQECVVQHIEQTPVLRNGRIPCVVRQEGSDPVALFFREHVPDLLMAHLQTDDQGARFHRLLIGRKGIACSELRLHLCVGPHIVRIAGRHCPQDLCLVIIPHPVSADRQVRLDRHQRRRDKQGPGQALEIFRLHLPGRRVFVRISDLILIAGQDHRVLKMTDTLKRVLQKILSRFDPGLSGRPGVRAQLEVQCFRLKFHALSLLL